MTRGTFPIRIWLCSASAAASMTFVCSKVSAREVQPAEPAHAPERNFSAELHALLTQGLTEDQQRASIAARDELIVIADEVARIDAAIEEEARAWDGAAAVPEDEWMVDLSWFKPEFVPGHPVLMRMAREAVARYEAAGLPDRIEAASRMPRWPAWDGVTRDKDDAMLSAWFRGTHASRCADRVLIARATVHAEAGEWGVVVRDIESLLRLGRAQAGAKTLMIEAILGESQGMVCCYLARDLAMRHRPDAAALGAMASAIDAGLALGRRSEMFDAECLWMLAGLTDGLDPFSRKHWLPSVIEAVEAFRDEAARQTKRSYRERMAEPFDVEQFINQRKQWLNPLDNSLDALLPDPNLTLRFGDRSACESRGIRLLLAVERFRAERGVLPPGLDALVPEFIGEMPVDPFAPDGRFRYKRIDAGADPHGRDYLIYSVGSDGTDDGGVPAPGDEGWDYVDAVNGECARCDFVINRVD